MFFLLKNVTGRPSSAVLILVLLHFHRHLRDLRHGYCYCVPTYQNEQNIQKQLFFYITDVIYFRMSVWPTSGHILHCGNGVAAYRSVSTLTLSDIANWLETAGVERKRLFMKPQRYSYISFINL